VALAAVLRGHLRGFGGSLHKFGAITPSMCNLRPSSRGHVRMAGPDPFAAQKILCNYLSTDTDCRVDRVAGPRAVDASAMPTINSGNHRTSDAHRGAGSAGDARTTTVSAMPLRRSGSTSC
jgi:hypothetical protein